MLSAALAAIGNDPPGLLPAREQMALSLGWHIVLASFGVAFPVMIWVVHRRALRRNDPVALELAKRWSKVAAVLFAIGAVSGTILSFEMGLLWPGLMGRFGDVLGLPFALEGIAFFTEAIFIGIYLYGWNRMRPERHLFMLVPVGIAGVVGTFCVLSVNAWMNAPTGFAISPAGKVVNVNPWRAMFNDAVGLEFAHMFVGAFMLVGFTVAAVYAVGMLRGRGDEHHQLGFIVPFAFASVAAIAQPLIGHVLGLQTGSQQPSKLAAMELATHPEASAPLRLGGVLVGNKVVGAIEIPRIGSIIAKSSLHGTVPGLDQFPKAEQPPANITHLAFQGMVAIGTVLALFVLAFWIFKRRGRTWIDASWFLKAAAVAGPLSILALECGWVATEVGRQPWTVWHILTTRQAASTSHGLWISFGVLFVVYTGMTVGAAVVLRSMARRWREGAAADLPTPYGPNSPLDRSFQETPGAEP